MRLQIKKELQHNGGIPGTKENPEKIIQGTIDWITLYVKKLAWLLRILFWVVAARVVPGCRQQWSVRPDNSHPLTGEGFKRKWIRWDQIGKWRRVEKTYFVFPKSHLVFNYIHHIIFNCLLVYYFFANLWVGANVLS